MGFRFRKSIKVGGVRVNFSKSGVGYSIGTKGARITKTANGRTRTTAGIPGTGISYVSESRKKGNSVSTSTTAETGSFVRVTFRLVAFLLLAIGFAVLASGNDVCIVFFVFGVLLTLLTKKRKKKEKQTNKEQ